MSPRLATADAWGIPAMPQASLRRSGVQWAALQGWGDANETAKGVQIGSSVASPVIAGIVGSHAGAIVAATGAPAFFALPAVAVPLIGAALVGATILITTLIRNSGCGQTCVVTSQWANQAQDALKANIDAYFALPAPRTKAQQGVALANFDGIWAALQQQCGQPGTGDAGKRCISDRERGACKWKATENSQWPGGVQLGECFNWFVAFRDPIAHDSVVANPSLDSIDAALSEVGGSNLLPLLAIGGLLAVAVAL